MRPVLFLLLLASLLSGCGARQTFEPVLGDVLFSDSFTQAGSWDQYDAPTVQMQIAGGIFTVIADAGQYVFSLNSAAHDDVVIDADLTILSEDRSNGAGILCRANASRDGDGYYFLIGSDGSASIRRGQGREVKPLLSWTLSSAVRSGVGPNRIRAVCIGDRLALYVNGELVGEVRDRLYSRGLVGIAAVSTRPGERIEVNFNALTVTAATIK
jgi:hypothetical protein